MLNQEQKKQLEEVRELIKKIIIADRELAEIQLGEYEPFIIYQTDTKPTVDKILGLPSIAVLDKEQTQLDAKQRKILLGSMDEANFMIEQDDAIQVMISALPRIDFRRVLPKEGE